MPIEVILDRIATRSDLELTETRLTRRIVVAMLAGMAIVAGIAAGASALLG